VPGEPPEERIVDFVYMPLQEADGSISGVFVHGVDLTERVKAEKEAEEAWEWLRRVADTTPDIIFILNIVENRNVYANRSLLTCLGYDPDSFTAVDNVLERVLVPEDVNEAERFYREMASANPGEVRLFTNRAYHRDGSIRWIENRVSPFRWDDNGTLLEVIGVATDVTDRMEVEARLRTSEARYRAIVESQSEMVSRFRLDGTLLFVNGAYARSRGTTPDAIIGGNFWEWIPEEEHASVREMLTRLTPDSPEVRIENQFHTAEGVRWTLWTNRALEFDEDGRPLEFQSAGIDITDLKLAEEARRQSEDLVRTIAENSTQGLAMMDEHGYCTYANKAWLEMTGYTAEEIGSKPLHYLVHHHYPDGRPYPKEECPLDRALPENFDVRAHEDLFFRKDGSSFPVMCAASPIFEEGRPVATVIEIRDVTAAKQAEEELRRSRDELEQRVRERTAELEAANREMESFNYSIAHDLRGPLRAIVATSAMLLADAGPKLTEDERQELVTQQEAAKKLARLIDDLLHLSRLSRQPVVKAPFDLSVLVHEVLREMGAKALARHKIQVEPGMIAVGDQGLIKLVLHNLIENSIKYSPDGGRIEIGRHRDAFFVRDQGIGFDMQYAHKLFMPFERLHREEEYPGSGIGLASVKRIVERHGGKVWAESAPANGAAFYFTLPPNGQ
jgi:PAS domain S-box-containing protein